MKIKALRAMGFRGAHIEPGTVVECTTAEAMPLIGNGKAVEWVVEEPKKRTDRSVGLETSEPKQNVTKRAYRKKEK